MYVGKTTKLTKPKRNIMTLALVSDTRATASLWHRPPHKGGLLV